MLVKAKWNVKDAAGWHRKDEVFETSDDLGENVEIIVPDVPEQKPEKKPEPEKAPEKPKAPTRRKNSK